MFIIDVQGFQYGKDNFLCREIAILNVDNGVWQHRFITFPLDMSHYNSTVLKHMEWYTEHLHGLEWSHKEWSITTIRYEQITEFIRKCIGCYEGEEILVKGLEKKIWLERLLRMNNIIDLHEQGCPAIEDLKLFLRSNHCNQHLYNNSNCALENVYLLWYWYLHCEQWCVYLESNKWLYSRFLLF